MKISILFLCYNHRAFVAQAIQSVFTQDYPEFELVVCEDCSKDNTRELLELELAKCPPHITVVRAYSEKNSGVKRCFNRCFEASSGDIAIHMSGDDISEPNRIQKLVAVFEKNPDCALAFSDCMLIGPAGERLEAQSVTNQPPVLAYRDGSEAVFAASHICGASAAYRRDIHTTFGPLIPGHHPEDMGYWPRALMLGEIRFIPEPLVRWRAHASNINNNLNKIIPQAGDAKKDESIDQLRRKWLGHTRMFISFSRQWERDFVTAISKNPGNKAILAQVLRRARADNEMRRILKYGIKRSPWKLWLGSAWRLFKLKWPRPCVNTLVYAWKIRVSDKSQTRYLALHR